MIKANIFMEGFYFMLIVLMIPCIHANVMKAGKVVVTVTPDACLQSKCNVLSTCINTDNEDGYMCSCDKGWIGKYCDIEDHQSIPDDEMKQEMRIDNTNFQIYAISVSLGSTALLLIILILLMICKKFPQPQAPLTYENKMNIMAMIIEEHKRRRNELKSPEPNSTVYSETNSTVNPETNSTVNPETNSTVYQETNSAVYSEANSAVYSDANSTVYSETNSTVYSEYL